MGAINSSDKVTQLADVRASTSVSPVGPSKSTGKPTEINANVGVGPTPKPIPTGQILAFNHELRNSASPRVASSLWSKRPSGVESNFLDAARKIVDGDQRAKLVSGVITKGLNILGVS